MSEYKNGIIIVLVIVGVYLLYVYIRNKKETDVTFSKKDFDVNYDFSKDFVKKNYDRPFDYLSPENGKKSYVSYTGKQYPYKVDLINDPDDEIVTNQYHPDYSRVVAYLNSRNKQALFNFACLPVVMQSDVEKKDVFPIVNRFVYELSNKTQIGLKLVDITNCKRYLVENQEKIQCNVILHKDSPIPSSLKMIVKLSYVYNTDDTLDENDFFEKAFTMKLQRRPLIDEINIVGYSTNTYDIESQAQTEYYAFASVEDERFLEENDVNNIVRTIRKKHAQENSCLNTDWDEDGKAFFFKDKMNTYYDPDGDLKSSEWGTTNRRNEQSVYTRNPRPATFYNSDNLYSSVGVAMLDI